MATPPKTQRLVETLPKPDQLASNPFSDPTPDSDLILVVEEQKLHVNKVVLSLASPVFKRMFEANFKERSSKKIPIPGKKFADMLEFLLCVYPSTSKPVTRETLDVVLPLAHEYQVQHLLNRCEEFVVKQLSMHEAELRNPPLKDLVHFLFLADKYDLKKLIEVCAEKMAARNYTSERCERAAEDFEEFKLVSVKTKYEVLLKRMRCLEPIARQISNGYMRDEAVAKLKTRCFSLC